MIQTNVFVNHFNGLNFDIEPKDMIKPSGNANINVRKNIVQVTSNPSESAAMTFINLLDIICSS